MSTYLRVIWKHAQNKYPIALYSELGEDRYESRKVELFRDGTYGYAYDAGSSGTTMLGELPVPSLADIECELEFEPSVISKQEFEDIWKKATSA